MTDPITQQRFNPLAYVPALALALGLAAGWASLKSDITATQLRIDQIDQRLAERIQAAATREADQEARLRTLELAQGRTDEKFNAILDRLADIQTQLERTGGQP